MVTGAATGRTQWEASGFPTQPRTSVWIQTKFSLEFVWKTKVALMKFFKYVMLCNVTRIMYVITYYGVAVSECYAKLFWEHVPD